MATARKDRFFAAFGAILFLVTTSALAVVVIVSLIQQHKSVSPGATSQQSSASSNNSSTSTTKENSKLQGTKLSNFTPVASVSQLTATDTTPGTGATAQAGDTLVVDYTGALAATGVIFQSSLDSGQTFSFKLGAGQVITGWDKGLVGVKAGGTRRLMIPAADAYGSQAQSGIPANSDLVFDITVHSVSS